MDQSQSTQEEENEQLQQVSTHSLSAQHTNTSPLIVSTPHPIREQHVNETVSSTRFFALQPIICIPRIQLPTRSKKTIVSTQYPPRETHSEYELSNSQCDINSPQAKKKLYATRTRGKRCQPSSTCQGASCADIPPAKRVHHESSTRTSGQSPCSTLKGAICTDIPPTKKVCNDSLKGVSTRTTLQRVIPKQLAGSSRQYESDDSDSTCIQQYESDKSQKSDGENSEIDDDTSQQHLIATSSQVSEQCSNFLKYYEELITVSLKWYDLGLALGLDRNTLENIKDINSKNETRLRETLSKRDNIKLLSWTEIIEALRNPIVGKNTLADRLQRKYAPESMSQSSSQPSSYPTPECVVRYASFLKDKYKQMPTFPDDWPPPLKEKFTKLALIERKKQICLPQAKHTQSIEYDYATGNVDNIVERKQTTTLEKIFQPLPSDSTPNRYIVVMDGAPGVGKTTLSRKICIDWAQGKLIKDHHIVILKPLRELRGHTAASLSDLINADDPELKEQIVKYIQKTSGSGVMFIFDGFDELSSKQRSDKRTIFWEIIRGNRLHNCSVLVTSRSYASGPLQEINRVNRHVEVLGFKKKDIEHCIKQNVTDKEKAKKLIQMLKERLDIVSLCYIPLNCRIVLYVYQQQDTLPDTLTQLYEVFILYTVKHYKPGINEIKYANNIEDFPATIIKCLDSLCELAYTGMTQDKLVFNYKEVTHKLDALALPLGLLNLIKTDKEQTEAHYYQFLHLTIQEFLAARHLARTKSNKFKQKFITSKIHDERFRMTLLFLSGLTKLDFIAVEQAFPASKSIEIGVKHKYKTIERSRFLFLAHFLYESQQTTYNWLLPCLVTNSLDLSEHSLSQFDCLVLANFLALTPKDHVWDEINLSQCSLTTDNIELLLSKKHLQRDNIPVLCLTKRLDLSTSATVQISPISFIALFGNDSKLENIYIPHLKLVEKICCQSLLGETLLRAQSLQELKMGSATSESSFDSDITCTSTCIRKNEIRIDTKICSGIIQKVFESVEPKKLKTIALCKPDSFDNCLQCGSLGSNVWDKFCTVIKNSEHIQHLQINKHHFTAQDIPSLITTFQNKENLSTLQFPGSRINCKGLIHLRNHLPLNVRAEIFTSYFSNLTMFLRDDNLVYFDIEPRIGKACEPNYHTGYLCATLTKLLEAQLPPELNGVIVTTKSFMSKDLLMSVGNSKIKTSLTVVKVIDEKFTLFAEDFRDMLESTETLQTLKLDSCELSDTSIKQLEAGLSLNKAVALTVKLENNCTIDSAMKVRSQNLREINVIQKMSDENVRQLSNIVTTCKQIRVLKVWLGDNSENFFHALSDNKSLRELRIQTTGKMSVLLFQTLPLTPITTLDLTIYGIGNYVSLAFKEFIDQNTVLTVLRANRCGLTDEAFTFTHASPLRELSLIENTKIDKGWTDLFYSLCSSSITTLDISGNRLYEEQCCRALNRLLLKNKTITVLRIGGNKLQDGDQMACSIADALSQNCSLRELKIGTYNLSIRGWIKLFKSLYENTKLTKLNCIDVHLSERKQNNEVAKSLCEMLIQNQGLQNLNIADELIECNLKKFAIVYIQRKPVLNLTVGKLKKQLVNEIEKLKLECTDKEYNIQNSV